MSYKVPVYGMYEDDVLIDKGTSKELAERHYVDQGYLTVCAKHNHKLLRQYTIRKLPDYVERTNNLDEARKQQNEIIKELMGKGIKYKYIAQRLHIPRGTVVTRVRAMRKRGEL